MRSPARTRKSLALIFLVLGAPALGARPPSFLSFESGPVRPVALAPNRNQLFVVNTPDNRLEIFDVAAGRLVDGRDRCSGTTLAPGASCRFLVEREPSAAGLHKAIAVIISNDPNEPRLQVALRGTGTP